MNTDFVFLYWTRHMVTRVICVLMLGTGYGVRRVIFHWCIINTANEHAMNPITVYIASFLKVTYWPMLPMCKDILQVCTMSNVIWKEDGYAWAVEYSLLSTRISDNNYTNLSTLAAIPPAAENAALNLQGMFYPPDLQGCRPSAQIGAADCRKYRQPSDQLDERRSAGMARCARVRAPPFIRMLELF